MRSRIGRADDLSLLEKRVSALLALQKKRGANAEVYHLKNQAVI